MGFQPETVKSHLKKKKQPKGRSASRCPHPRDGGWLFQLRAPLQRLGGQRDISLIIIKSFSFFFFFLFFFCVCVCVGFVCVCVCLASLPSLLSSFTGVEVDGFLSNGLKKRIS